MSRFELGDEALYYRNGSRVYGTVIAYNDPETVVLDVKDEDGETAELIITAELYVRPADDPDDPDPQDWR